MIRIAFIDDDQEFLHYLQQHLRRWFQANASEVSISMEEYPSGKEIVNDILRHESDLFFLDIEMPDINGIQLAARIREAFPFAIIIFLTSYSEYAPSGYKVQALRYLTKPLEEAQLNEALQSALRELEKLDRGSLSVVSYGNVNRIPYRDILYVRHVLRSSFIATVSMGTVKDGRGLKAIYDAIHDDRFLYIDRGTFVNVDHIQRIEGSQMVLRNGEKLIISRRMLSRVKLTINQLLGGE